MGKFTKIKNEEGTIFILTLLIFTLVSSWALFSVKNSFNNYKISQKGAKKMQAYYLAEAGLEETIAKIKAGREVDNHINAWEIGEIILAIDTENKSKYEKNYEIKAKGIIENTYEQTLIAKLKEYSLETPFALGETFIDKDEDFSINSERLIKGDVFVNGNLIFNSSVVIKGNIFVTKSLDFYEPCQIIGNLYVGESLKGEDLELYGNVYVENNCTIGKISLTGDLYTKGWIVITNEDSDILGNIYCNNLNESIIPMKFKGRIFTESNWPTFNIKKIKVLERKEGL